MISLLSSRWRIPILVLILIAFVAAYTMLLHDRFTALYPGANDFFSIYAGAYGYFMRGWNPYGPETDAFIHQVIGGGSENGLGLFAYPLYAIWIAAPLLVLPNYPWAEALWLVLCQGMIFVSLLVILRYFRWQPPVALFGVLVIWSIFFYPNARALLLGQVALLVFLLTVLVFWLLFRIEPNPRTDILAGILLAVTTIKPQMQFLIIPFLLLWGLRMRRWVFLASAAVSMLALIGISFLMLPSWLTDWLAELRLYPSYTPPAVMNILAHDILHLPGSAAQIVERVIEAGMAIYLLWEWWRVLWKGDAERLDWTLALTIVISHLVALRTATPHYVVFLFVLIPLLKRWSERGVWLPIAVLLALFVGYWGLFALTQDSQAESNLMFVPPPLIMLGLLFIFQPPERFPVVGRTLQPARPVGASTQR